MLTSSLLCALNQTIVSNSCWFRGFSKANQCSRCHCSTGDHWRGFELLQSGLAKQPATFGQTRLQGDRLQAVLAHRAHLDQLLPVTQHAQYFATLHCRSMQTGKLIVEHQIPNEFGIAPITLLPPTSTAPNFRGIAEPHFATELLEHCFEPGAVTTGFQADDHLTLELFVESSQPLFVLVL